MLSDADIEEQIKATAESLINDMPEGASAATARSYICDSREIVAGVLAILEEALEELDAPTIH
jgi:hypothetical protein